MTEDARTATKRRCALSPSELLRLDLWASAFTAGERFGMYSPMLVGSTMTGTTYRDVDVRVILDDDDPLLADANRLRLFHVAISVWAQQSTGLLVDFQFQSNSENQNEHGDKPRNPLGNRWRTVLSGPSAGGSESRVAPGQPADGERSAPPTDSAFESGSGEAP